MELVTHEDVDGRPNRRVTHWVDRRGLCSLCRIEEDPLAPVGEHIITAVGTIDAL